MFLSLCVTGCDVEWGIGDKALLVDIALGLTVILSRPIRPFSINLC